MRDPAKHAEFLGKLAGSRLGVWIVAIWLNEGGKAVMVPPEIKAKRHEDWADNVDGGDIIICLPDGISTQRVEVRHIGSSFTGTDDWEHGKHFMIATCPSFDRATPRPDQWITLSQDCEVVAVVDVEESFDHWYVEERTHGPNATEPGKRGPHYFCPLDFVKWRSTS